MIKKIGSFFEEHIEKVVLAVVVVGCIVLSYFYVIKSPNAVSYDKLKISPSEIDKRIREQAKQLENKLKQPPQPKPDYVSRLTGVLDPNDPVREGIMGPLQGGFAGLMNVAIPNVDTRVSITLPINISTDVIGGRQYALPLSQGIIGEVNDVAVEYIRAAAYIPTMPVTEDVPYENAAPEPNDLDLVTVAAKFNVAELYKKCKESFVGEDVPQQWRDPCLAVPVFAAVQLQRQKLLDDGSWSDWQDVPRSIIDSRKRMFEIVEHTDNLPPGGIKVRLLQFNDPQVTMDLLQPQAYQIASADQEWFPPSLHREFVELRKKEKIEQKREEIEAKKEEEGRNREQRLDDRRGSTTGTRSVTGRSSGGTSYNQGYGTEGTRDTRSARSRRGSDSRGGRGDIGYGDTGRYSDTLPGDRGSTSGRQRQPRRGPNERNPEMDYLTPGQGQTRTQPSSDDVYNKYQAILITELTDLSKKRDPLVFWAHDDTVEPGTSYRYRIRLGVFNPIAGTNQFKQQDKSLKNQVILWSGFSDITQSVLIPERMYIFARGIQEAAKQVTVQVSKYVLGYWYNKDFYVEQGEVIGKVEELQRETSSVSRNLRNPLVREPYRAPSGPRDSRVNPIRGNPRPDLFMPEEVSTEPESIDFSTGAVLVDAVTVNDWSLGGDGKMSPRRYYDMLYSFDGTSIERMAISDRNWPSELQTVYREIASLAKEPKEPLRDWQSTVGRSRRRTTPTEGYDYMDPLNQMMPEGIMPY